MKKPQRLVVFVGSAYAVAIAGLASGNILHNYFGNKGDVGNEFNNNDFNLNESETSSLLASSEISVSEPDLSSRDISGESDSSPSSVEPIPASSSSPSSSGENHPLATSPYTETVCTPSLNNYAEDSRGYTVKYYTVDVKIKKISDLRTNLVVDSSGRPGDTVTDIVSNQVRTVEKALNTEVLAAISGDSAFSYNHRPGYVIRNGNIVRSTLRNAEDATNPDCILWKDGTMSSIWEADYTPQQLISMGAIQNWMFGPNLIENGQIAVNEDSEIVSETMAQGGNQRTAIGYLGPFHYLFFVSQGRKQWNRDGFTLHDMAEILLAAGCQYAYNLDGGGSSTIVVRDETNAVKKYPQENEQRGLGDMIYVVDC